MIFIKMYAIIRFMTKRHPFLKSSSECGRIMIEMIAFLALFGLLTVGSINGFNFQSDSKKNSQPKSDISLALNKTKAINLINEITERLILYKMQHNSGAIALIDTHGPVTRDGYPFRLNVIDTHTFNITISRLNKEVCQQVLQSDSFHATRITVNNATVTRNSILCNKNENTISYTFDKNRY